MERDLWKSRMGKKRAGTLQRGLEDVQQFRVGVQAGPWVCSVGKPVLGSWVMTTRRLEEEAIRCLDYVREVDLEATLEQNLREKKRLPFRRK